MRATSCSKPNAELGGAIEAKIAAQQKSLAFGDGPQRESIAALVAITKDAEKAFELQAIAMDLARGKGIDLATATDMRPEVARVDLADDCRATASCSRRARPRPRRSRSCAAAATVVALGPIILIAGAVALAVGALWLAWENNFPGHPRPHRERRRLPSRGSSRPSGRSSRTSGVRCPSRCITRRGPKRAHRTDRFATA